ncbi:MAG: 6-bladed beta-propeller [Gracilimonas sp.]
MSLRYLLVLPIVLLLVNCSTPENNEISNNTNTAASVSIPEHLQDLENLSVFTDFDPAGSVEFEQEHSYGEIYPALLAPQLFFGAEVAVDNEGNVYRADKAQRTILVFDGEGNEIQQIGRDGRGPGEFQAITAIGIHEDLLSVFDGTLSRISVFNIKNFELIESIPVDPKAWANKVEAKYYSPRAMMPVDNEMYLTAVFEEKEDGSTYSGYYMMDNKAQIVSGKITETLNKNNHVGKAIDGHSVGIRLTFSVQGKIAVAPSGKVYHINTGEFLIKAYNETGSMENAIYYPFEKDGLEEQEVLNEYHPNMHPALDNAEFPNSWPALESLIIDDENRIWVSAIVDDKNIRQWYILEESGELLAVFPWSRDSEILTIRKGKLYTEETDPETQAKVVVSYDIKYSGI